MNQEHDADLEKGAIEQDRPSQKTNTSMEGQLPHRTENPTIKGHDTDYPEPGENAEHSGEPQKAGLQERDAGCESPKRQSNPEGATQDQDPGQRQKRNQADKKDDPLAA